MTEVFAIVGIFCVMLPFVIGLAILGLMWRAWWLYPAWGWFIVPLGLPSIQFWHFVALTLLVGTLTAHIDDKKDERPTEWAKVGVGFIWPIIVWVILRWMRI